MVKVIALHTFMTSKAKLIEKGTVFETEDNQELQLWLARNLVARVIDEEDNSEETNIGTEVKRKKKNKKR